MIEINLLPKEYKKRGNVLSFDKKMIYISVAVAALVVAMAGATFYQSRQMSRLDRLITKARMEENRYKKDIAIIDALTEVKAKILARVDAIEKLDHRRKFYISLLEDLNSRLPEYLWMTGFTETPADVQTQASAQPAKSQQANQPVTPAAKSGEASGSASQENPPPEPDIGSATIEGYAYNLNSLGAFIIALMKSDFFRNVQLNRAVAEDVGTVTAFNFKISCDLNYNAHLMLEEIDDSEEGMHISSTQGHEGDDAFDGAGFNEDSEEQ